MLRLRPSPTSATCGHVAQLFWSMSKTTHDAKIPSWRQNFVKAPKTAYTPRPYSTTEVPQLRKTSLHHLHTDHGGTMVSFGGYSMPVRYADMTIGESHRWTREKAGLFDVGHMVQHRLSGPSAQDLLLKMTPSSITQLPIHRSILSCFLQPETGGVVDDTVITRLGPDVFHLVTNAACRDKDAQYISNEIANFGSRQSQVRWQVLDSEGLVALQGPLSATILRECLTTPATPDLSQLYFGHCAKLTIRLPSGRPSPEVLVTRTGYTGEDGFEISIPAEATSDVAASLLSIGGPDRVRLAGLGARDSLRLEAGMCLYGYELTEETTPVDAGLSWIIGADRKENGGFHGADRILHQLASRATAVPRRRVGLIVQGSPARGGAVLKDSDQVQTIGKVTSGGPSPTLGKNIAMAYVQSAYRKVGTTLIADVRGKAQEARVVKLPFVPAKFCRQSI